MANRFSPGCCCSCNCEHSVLSFESDGSNGFADWIPAAAISPAQSAATPDIVSDVTLVSREDVFCKTAATPFYAYLNGFESFAPGGIGNTLPRVDGVSVRIMTRLTVSFSDGFAVIGDHCFVELEVIDGPAGYTEKTAAVRVGVCFDGEDFVLANGAGFANSLQTQLVSPFGMIKDVLGSNVPISHFDDLINRDFDPLSDGDYFLASDDVVINAGVNGTLLAAKGSLYRLVDSLNYDHPDSWQLVSADEFNDVVFGAGLPSQATSLLLSDSPKDFSALPGQRVGVRFSGLSESNSFPAVSVIAGNSVSPSLPLCDVGVPPMQLEAVFRETPFATYTATLTGGPSSLPFRGFTVPLVDSVYSEGYRGPVLTEYGISSGGYQFTRSDYFKLGPTGSPLYAWQYIYFRVSVSISLDISQRRVGSWSALAHSTLEIWEGVSISDISLAALQASPLNQFGAFALEPTPGAIFNIPTYPGGFPGFRNFGKASSFAGPYPGHYMDEYSAELSPNASSPDATLAALISVYDLTISVPVPQP